MTTWLNPVEQRAWRAIVALLTRLPSSLDTELQRKSGVTHFEYWALMLLADEPERRLQMSELARRAHASLSRLSHVVSKLERMGWARRTTTAGSRGVQVNLTDAGHHKVIEAAPGYVDMVHRLVFRGLDTQQTSTLADLAETLQEHVNEQLGPIYPAPSSSV